MYTIKPLPWREKNGDHTAETPFSHYTVWQNSIGGWLWTCTGGCRVQRCASLEEGKAQAEAHWRGKLAGVLEVVQ